MRHHSLNIGNGPAAIHAVDSEGAGPAIVLIHSSGFSGAAFANQLSDSIARKNRLIAVDLPGHGRSSDAENPARGYTIAELARTLEAALGTISLGPYTLCGWGIGGHLALEMAARDPSVIGTLLVGTPPVSPGTLGLFRAYHANWDAFLSSKASFTAKDCRRWSDLCLGESADDMFIADIARSDGAFRAHVLKSLMEPGPHSDQRRFVETAAIPIGIINGARDPFVRRSHIESLAYANLWRGRCHLIPGTGHAPFWFAAELFNPLLEKFAAEASIEANEMPGRSALVA